MKDVIQIDLNSLKKKSWSAEETKNAELITDFVQHLMNNHDFDYIRRNYGENSYVQHNRLIPEGIKGIIGYIKNFAGRFPEFTYDVKHIYVDGEYVTFHSHATARKKDRGNEKKGFNISDTWKVEDGKIVEHWDSVQPIDWFMRLYAFFAGGSIRNQNGVF